jgi:predicted GIY-YIG superfamily endonuclease
MEGETSLYRFFNNDGKLLYVGITAHLLDRIVQHEVSQPWWEEVVAMTRSAFPTRETAHNAEKRAIHEESPKYNSVRYQHRPRVFHEPTDPRSVSEWVLARLRAGDSFAEITDHLACRHRASDTWAKTRLAVEDVIRQDLRRHRPEKARRLG